MKVEIIILSIIFCLINSGKKIFERQLIVPTPDIYSGERLKQIQIVEAEASIFIDFKCKKW